MPSRKQWQPSDRFINMTSVLFPLMGIEIGMEIIYFHSEK